MASALIQTRVDESLKSKASDIFEQLGLDLQTAIRMFLTRAVQVRGIPFEMTLSVPEVSDIARGVRAMRTASVAAERAGVGEMSLDEINEEIALYRGGR